MTNRTKPANAKQSDAATLAASASAPKKPVPVTKTATKTTTKSPARAAVKPAAKAVPKAAATATPDQAQKAAPTPVAKAEKNATAKVVKSSKPKKAKMIRDSFTMPESEYKLLAEVKRRCIAKGVAVKKSEVLRAAIIGFVAQSDAAVMAAVKALEAIKTGRPPKD